ncbi:uncharacterized protein LOC119616472 [Lucilia sericata]|uniref:uncharacterized protein LOC119616472 n=1 Tax=Lucilia sericata TaxID=13632 RepID=UPI0018A82906|nr:uncharacterized protein LOC119616472 [Lucilia sericata]
MRAFLVFVTLFTLAQANNLGYNYDSQNINSGTNHSPFPNVVLQKEFYTYSAPDNVFDDVPNIGELTKTRKMNLRVIFIRAPENNGLANAITNLVRSRVESKTAIYVLTKQTDIGSLTQQLQNLNTQNPNKPEVRFVKYRTEEEAVNAQRIIQQQYETLGGKTQVHNGGVAPVLNFASKKPLHQPVSYTSHPVSHSYIPPNV